MSDEPEIVYADTGAGAIDHYDPITNQIVLNEQLKEYPLAHSYVLKHEYRHYEIGADLVGQLLHELKNDFEQAFSLQPAIEEMREYHDTHGADPDLKRNMAAAMVVNLLRIWWQLVFVPTGFIYRTARKSRAFQNKAGGGS